MVSFHGSRNGLRRDYGSETVSDPKRVWKFLDLVDNEVLIPEYKKCLASSIPCIPIPQFADKSKVGLGKKGWTGCNHCMTLDGGSV